MSIYRAGETFPKPCPECQGMRIVAWAGDVDLRRKVSYPALAFCNFFAVVCIQCGHTTLFADDLKQVRMQLEKHPKDFQGAARRLRQQLDGK